MAKGRKKQFGVNVVSAWIQQGARIVVGFLMLPYVMNRLGQEEYGIYQLAYSAIIFLNFLQVGMGPTLIRFSAQSLMDGNEEQIKKVSSNGQFILIVFGMIGMICILLLTPGFVRFYNIPLTLVSETKGMLVCMAVSFFLSFSSIAQQSLLKSANRYELSNIIMAIQYIFQAALLVLMFEIVRPSLYFYGIAILFSQIIRVLFLHFFVFKELGNAAFISFRAVDHDTIAKLLGFSLLILVQTISYSAMFQGQSLLIGKILGPDIVALFAPALLVATSIQMLIGQSLNPLITLAAQEKQNVDSDRLGSWALQISKMVAFVGFGFLTLFFLFGEPLIGLWLGEKMAWLWKVVLSIGVGAVLMPVQGVITRMALGASSIKADAASMLILALVVLSGSALGMLYSGWSIFEVSIFMSLCIIFRSFYIVFHYTKDFNYKFSFYIKNVYVKTAFVSICVVLLSNVVLKPINSNDLLALSLQFIFVGIVYLIAGWFLLLPSSFKKIIKQKLLTHNAS